MKRNEQRWFWLEKNNWGGTNFGKWRTFGIGSPIWKWGNNRRGRSWERNSRRLSRYEWPMHRLKVTAFSAHSTWIINASQLIPNHWERAEPDSFIPPFSTGQLWIKKSVKKEDQRASFLSFLFFFSPRFPFEDKEGGCVLRVGCRPTR